MINKSFVFPSIHRVVIRVISFTLFFSLCPNFQKDIYLTEHLEKNHLAFYSLPIFIHQVKGKHVMDIKCHCVWLGIPLEMNQG